MSNLERSTRSANYFRNDYVLPGQLFVSTAPDGSSFGDELAITTAGS